MNPRQRAAIRNRIGSAHRVYIPTAFDALGRLRNAGSLGTLRHHLLVGPRDRILPAGSIALARLRGGEAGDELLLLWDRAA